MIEMTFKLHYRAGLLIALLAASPANAFEFSGSEVSLQYHNWYTAGPQKAIGNANIEFELGNGVFGQVGGTAAAIVSPGTTLDFGSLDIHLDWHATDGFDVGAFAGVEKYTYANAPYDYHAGVEAAFTFGDFDGQVYAGQVFEAQDPDLEILAGIDLSYAMTDTFSVGVGAFYNSEPGNWKEIYLDASARYDFGNGWFVEGIYSARPQFADHGIGVRFGLTTGGGTTFGNRNFSSLANSFY